ncbi:MAG TPA: TIGR04282 family arsenosugar biosynthesis glycosyltransferase [Burkholderiales bacterium]|nr:TIGR04282 family arsenosugar biosynthesis glycosyltransferase [Burkholderiales bacterium]
MKTRLAARLGATRARRLHERLTAAALGTARAARCGPVELHVTAHHAWLKFLSSRHALACRLQRGENLGERMAHATREALRRAPFVVLIGADCPELGSRELRRAARWLRGGADVVLAPAHDGGYALVGLARPADFLFRDMPWGSERVYAESVARLERAGARWRALACVSDVDRPEDLACVRWLRLASAARQYAR